LSKGFLSLMRVSTTTYTRSKAYNMF
jgi:hypothetical protein